MARDGSLERVGAFVLLDMVGDRDLDLVNDTGSSPRLRRFLREEAERMGVGEIVERGSRLHVVDDHVPPRGLIRLAQVVPDRLPHRGQRLLLAQRAVDVPRHASPPA